VRRRLLNVPRELPQNYRVKCELGVHRPITHAVGTRPTMIEQPQTYWRNISSVLRQHYQYVTPLAPSHRSFDPMRMSSLLFALLTVFTVLNTLPGQAQKLPSVMPARIVDDSTDAAVTATKVEAGLALAFDLTERFEYVPSTLRDSLVALRTSEPVTTLQAAEIVQAQIAVFASCVRVANLVRAEVTLRSGDSLETERRGVGYAAIRHYNDSGVVADPAILTALQRALCEALQEPDLYAGAPTDLRTGPTTLVGIGGIAFENDSTVVPHWNLFEDRTVVSFDLAINLVHELQSSPALTVVDLDTRDSMFAMGGMLLIENDRPVSNFELRILRLFDVHQIITGSFVRDAKGAILTLQWCRIEPDGRYTVERTAQRRVDEDSAVTAREAMLACTADLVRLADHHDR